MERNFNSLLLLFVCDHILKTRIGSLGALIYKILRFIDHETELTVMNDPHWIVNIPDKAIRVENSLDILKGG